MKHNGWWLALLITQCAMPALGADRQIGLFQGQADVGSVTPAGAAAYDPASGRYTLRSAGANTWYHVDAFHYVWVKTSGDWTLSAEVRFPPHTYSRDPNPHRKGVLMFRQSLDPGSEYAALALHGSGLTALQYRHARGANTEDSEINEEFPQTLRLEKRGDVVTAFVSMPGEPPHPVGASTRLHLIGSYYVGIGALSHEPDLTDTVEFAHVTLDRPQSAGARVPQRYSTLQVIQTEDQYRRATVLRSAPASMSSPAWNGASKAVFLEENGRLEQVAYHEAPANAQVTLVVPGSLTSCPGHLGPSPDGRWLAITCRQSPQDAFQVYILPQEGGAPRELTRGTQSSFFHAWSADGRSIAFTRGSGASKADVFTIAVDGGNEVRLTSDGVNDGPDFSPDGKFIYFDKSHSGTTQIWRMHPDGSAAEQITDDEHENSSPHISPDGKSLAFLSRPAAAGDTIGDASIKIMGFDDGLIRTLVEFQGNRDSLSMQSWGDRNHLAFISYQSLP